MFHQPDLFAASPVTSRRIGMPEIIEIVSAHSRRPRYAFMVLNLIARAAGGRDRAGPYVQDGDRRVQIRDWLCEALIPVAQRDPRRRAIIETVRSELERSRRLPNDPVEAEWLVQEGVRARVLRSGRCNVSRAVSDLVNAGLLKRHYQGVYVDHANRGAQREAVYVLTPAVRMAFNSSMG